MVALWESLEDLKNTELFLEYPAKNLEITACLQQIQAYPVCPCCFMELPSLTCREVGCESWRSQDLKTVCSHCGQYALYDGSRKHWQLVRESLRHRVRAECELAQMAASGSDDARISNNLAKDSGTMLKRREYMLWCWTGSKK